MSDYSEVSELAGTEISAEQLYRMSHRYQWAAHYCHGMDVLEVACGSGQGLGLLLAVAKSLEAGDYSDQILSITRVHYGGRVRLLSFDAQSLPYEDAAKDIVILFEALYYIPNASRFVHECRRVLRRGGRVLIATANKDLSDFNPSPLSHHYYGAAELSELFRSAGFEVELYGYLPLGVLSWRQKVLRPIKKLVVALGIMPKTMRGKRLLKRLVFGKLVPMPAELPLPGQEFLWPISIPKNQADRIHKVLYCCATLRG